VLSPEIEDRDEVEVDKCTFNIHVNNKATNTLGAKYATFNLSAKTKNVQFIGILKNEFY
jgi:hypothetical protein